MFRLAVPLLAGVLALAACGGDDAEPAASEQSPSLATVTKAAAAANDADISFVQGMIPHHEQAVEMAEVALDPRSQASLPVQDLATRIKQAQDPEIQLMRGWLISWGAKEMDMDGDMAGHDMDGMMSAEDMESLERATGPAFDQRWMAMMIEHHEGAITMSEKVKANGSNPDVKALAGQIIAAQQAEIEEIARVARLTGAVRGIRTRRRGWLVAGAPYSSATRLEGRVCAGSSADGIARS